MFVLTNSFAVAALHFNNAGILLFRMGFFCTQHALLLLKMQRMSVTSSQKK